jgi:hypothetical protein
MKLHHLLARTVEGWVSTYVIYFQINEKAPIERVRSVSQHGRAQYAALALKTGTSTGLVNVRFGSTSDLPPIRPIGATRLAQ